jgi:hemolysin activation/secretion protein
MRVIASGLLLAACALALVPAAAQTPADIQRIQQENQRRILEEQQREQQRIRELEERARKPRGEDLAPKPAPPPKTDDRCFDIREVVLEGVTKLSAADQAELTRPYTGRCVGLGEVNELLQKITNLYVSRGFTTSRVYIPEQDMSTGVLKILVLEGLVEKILLDGDGVSLRMAFPDLEGRVFNLREFEQGIDQINRLRSNSATMDIEPGAAPGASIVRIKNAPAKRWSLGLSVDNTGSKPTGYYQAAVVAGLDNPLGLNDYLNLSYRQNPDADEGAKLSRAQSLFYAVPYGAWMFSANASSFDSASRIQGAVVNFLSTSENVSKGVKAERVMLRDQFLKLSLSTGLTHKDNRSYLNGELVGINSRELTVWDGNANLSVNAWGGLWSFDLGFAQGLDAASALQDAPGLPPQAPRAQYFKQTFGANLSMPLKVGDTTLSWQSTALGQHSRDVLYGTEQILVGGPFSVRGFRQTSISGDSGYYWRNELSTMVPLAKLLPGYDGNAQLRPYIGYDIGHIYGKYGIPGGTLAGSTLGFNLFAAPLSFQLGYSRPEIVSSRINATEERYTYIRVALDF